MPPRRARSFAPVAGPGARILILGSMPGEASLAARQYYAHPRNQFWSLMESICGVPRSMPYEARLGNLMDAGVALWDVLHSCIRPGSLDASIEHSTAVPNALPQLLRAHPGIVRICCNGATAWRALLRHFGAELQQEFPHVQCIRLPSTSPAHAGMSPAAKLAAWRRAIRDA